MRRLVGVLLVVAVVGCGEEELSRADREAVRRVSSDISQYCLHNLFPEVIPTGVDRLIEIHREHPDATFKDGEATISPRGTLEWAAGYLVGDHCGKPPLAQRRTLAEKIERALNS